MQALQRPCHILTTGELWRWEKKAKQTGTTEAVSTDFHHLGTYTPLSGNDH